jgi:broad specificity phosphatase PhoE
VSEPGRRTRLYLVRHAAVAGWAAGRCCGRTDVPLSDSGRASAERLAASFAGLGVEAVYSSPLRRAVATAEPVAAAVGRQVVRLEALAELDFGTVEGLTFAEIALAHPELSERWLSAPTTVRFPGGESYADVRARAVAAVEEIVGRHRGAAAVAVGHAGPIRAVVGAVLEVPDRAAFRIDVAHASVSVVEWLGDDPVVLGINLERAREDRRPGST